MKYNHIIRKLMKYMNFKNNNLHKMNLNKKFMTFKIRFNLLKKY